MLHPALDVTGADVGYLLALIDDCSPTAIDEHGAAVTVFFANPSDRRRAEATIHQALPGVSTRAHGVDDEDWASRSQRSLGPVEVGALTIAPPWAHAAPADAGSSQSSRHRLVVITPSMGFGTGHHATTRLCLAALQMLPLEGRTALDVGTGSGVLAIAARLLGAAGSTGIDHDPDAVEAARANLADNPDARDVAFVEGDVRRTALEQADVVTANLTGTLLVAAAARLVAAVRPGGTLIVSGLLDAERDTVIEAFSGARLVWESSEEGWTALAFNREATIEA